MITRNCFNYIGGKDKLITSIQKHFPTNISNMYELFAGSSVVSLNTKADKYYLNDKSFQMLGLLKCFYTHDAKSILNDIDSIIKQYGLSKENKEGYLKLREDYNKSPIKNSTDQYIKFIKLYCLQTHSFNYQMTFNKMDEFNVPSGASRSYFNPSLRNKLVNYLDKLQSIDITFTSTDFTSVLPVENSFVYVDPPYLLSDDSYSRTHYLRWTQAKETFLYNYLNYLNSKNIKFALSNILEQDNDTNHILEEFRKKYNTHYIDIDYNNCNYQKKNKLSKEVLVTNY